MKSGLFDVKIIFEKYVNRIKNWAKFIKAKIFTHEEEYLINK